MKWRVRVLFPLTLVLVASSSCAGIKKLPYPHYPVVRDLRLTPSILDSEQALLRGTVLTSAPRYFVEVNWGDGKIQQETLVEPALKLAHDYDLLGTFQTQVKVCVPVRLGRFKCTEAGSFHVTVRDDDTSGPTVKLEMPRGVVTEDVPRRVSWEISDPSGLSTVKVDLSAPDGFRKTFRSPSGEFDFGDRGLGGYRLFITAVDDDDDQPGDRAGAPVLYSFVVTGDTDNDGIRNHRDNCPAVYNPNQKDRDFDGFGDACDRCPLINGRQPDKDGDGVGDACDNCPDVRNPDQENTDGDLLGNACDDDADNDDLPNEQERQLKTDPFNRDTDGGGTSDGREIELKLNPLDPGDDLKRPAEVVNRFVPDRLLVRLAYNLPEEEVARLVAEFGAKVRSVSKTTGLYELLLQPGSNVEEIQSKLNSLRGPSEEGDDQEQLVYAVPDYLGTFEWAAPQEKGETLEEQKVSIVDGVVKDRTGAVLHGVRMRAVNLETGNVFEAVTTARGNYRLPALPPGLYRIEAERWRFKKYMREPVKVVRGRPVKVDIVMEAEVYREPVSFLPSDVRFAAQTGFRELLEVWKVERGANDKEGVVIALIDTGLDIEHEDLRENIWRNVNEQIGDWNRDGCPGVCGVDDDGDGLADFEDPEVKELLARGFTRAQAAADDDENGYIDDIHGYDFAADIPNVKDKTGHGTHVAGIVGAVGNNQKGVAGVMWKTRLMPLKVAREEDGLAELDDVIRAMRYAGQNGADIILHSYIITLHNPSEEAIADLRAMFGRTGTRHILHVAAAGNQGRDLARKRRGFALGLRNLISDQGFFVFPVSLGVEILLGVAAHDESGVKLADFTNRGKSVIQMAAPGVNMLSTLPGNRYGYRSGTSDAAGYLAGVVGLLLNRYPELRNRPLEVVNFLRERSTEFQNPNILTNLFYQFTHPPVLTGTLYDETPFRFPSGFCGNNTYDADLFDADGDGDLDILEVNGNPGTGVNAAHLYLNDGNGRFTDASSDLGTAVQSINAIAADQADIDNDGDLDIIFASFTPPAPTSNRKNILLINQGGLQGGTEGTFADGSAELPGNFDVTRDVDFCDFDGDGFVDIFVTNAADDRVLRNTMAANTTCLTNPATDCFVDMTSTWLAGMAPGNGHNSQCVDVDGDGDADVITMNLDESGSAGQNVLLINRINEAAEQKFVNETGTWNIPIEFDTSHAVAAADIDDDNNDGIYGGPGDDPDLLIGRRQFGVAGVPQNNKVLINTGSNLFLEQTFGTDGLPGGATDRLPNVPEASTEVALVDIDGDGDPDLLEANGDANYDVLVQNRFYRNKTEGGANASGKGYFFDETSGIGIPLGYVQQSTDVAYGDIDGDGDTDVLFANYGGCPELYINSTADTAPTLTNIIPSTTLVGERVTITGTNFGPFQGAAGSVTFGGVDAGTVYHWTNARITVQVPVGCDGNGTPGTCNGGGVPTPTPKGSVPVVVKTATGKTSGSMNVTIGCFGGLAGPGVCLGSLDVFSAATVGTDADCTDDGIPGPCLPEPFTGAGVCSLSGNACTVDADCPGQTCSMGVCSLSGTSCMVDADCAVPSCSTPRHIKDVEFGDIDGDGDLDIFDVSSPMPVFHCDNPFQFTDRLLINTGSGQFTDVTGGADFNWSTKGDNPVPDFVSLRSYDSDLADINNDGFLDLVRADHQFCPGSDHYFVNQGVSPLAFSGGSIGVINDHIYWCEVTPGDVDGDGDLDLLFGRAEDNEFNVILINRHNQGGDCNTPGDCFELWNPQTAAPTHCPDWDDPDDPIDSVDCRDDLHTFTDRSHDTAWADLDGDRDLDIVIGGGTGNGGTSKVNRILLNRLVETGEMFFEEIPIPNETVADPTVAVMVADFNGDGRIDVHFANQGSISTTNNDKLYLNLGLVECGSPEEAACPDSLSCPVCGPGTDHFVCNRICWLDATSQLPESQTGVTQNMQTYGSDYGDVDGDGDLDFIVVDQFAGAGHQLILNQGFKSSVGTPPTWTACPGLTGGASCPLPGSEFPASTTPAAGSRRLAVYLGDVDGDGDLDIIWGSFDSSTGPFLLKNNAVP